MTEVASEIVAVQLLSKPIAVALVTIVVISAIVLDSIVVTAVETILTVVLPFNVFNSAAVAPVSVTVTARALLLLASTRFARVAIAPSSIVAVIAPVVSPSRVINCATLVDPERVTASLARPVIVEL